MKQASMAATSLASFAFTQFLFSPVIGNLSDRFGRRPVLLSSSLFIFRILAFDTILFWPLPPAYKMVVHRGRVIARHHRRQHGLPPPALISPTSALILRQEQKTLG